MINIKTIANYKHCFFDFFGTIMFRKCSADDIKKIWANRFSKILGCGINSNILYEMRITCESILSGRNNSEFIYEDLISLVYDRVRNLLADKKELIDKQKFINKSRAAEICIEKENQVINEEIVDLIKQLKTKGRKVYILSDFYFGSLVIKEFLIEKNVDLNFDSILVSCELKSNKLNGEIYENVLKMLNVKADECFMVGDNRKSDYTNAIRAGFSAYCIGQTKRFDASVKSERVLNKLLVRNKKDCANYTNFAFVLFRYIEILYDELRYNNHEQVFFFSREGEFLKKLFDIYCRAVHDKFGLPVIVSKYLYVSRQSTYVAGLQDLQNETFSTLFKEYKSLNIRAFLKTIGVSDCDINNIQENMGLNIDQQIENFGESVEFAHLLNNNIFYEVYKRTILKANSLLVGYLEEQGFYKNNKVAVVDVGWKGSIQDNIFKASIHKNVSIYGYYYGLTEKTYTTDGNEKKGLIFHNYPVKSQDFPVWSFDYNFLERLLTASHPSTKTYREEQGKFIPEFNDFGSEEKNHELILPLQRNIENLFEKITEIVYNLPLLYEKKYGFLKKAYAISTCRINRNNIRLQHRLLFGQMENFGFQEVAGDRMNKVFSLSNIIKKVKNNYRMLKDPLKIAKVLMVKRMYFTSSRIYRAQYKKLLK